MDANEKHLPTFEDAEYIPDVDDLDDIDERKSSGDDEGSGAGNDDESGEAEE